MNSNLNNTKMKKIAIFVLGALSLGIPFIIFGTVYGIGGAPVYEKKDVLAYYGSIIGACFTGFITAAGLYYTLYQNAETFNEQRRIDKKYREEDKINSVMPVLKIGEFSATNYDMYLNANFTNKSFNPSSVDHIKMYVKNIGVGPAINITIKLGDYSANNSMDKVNTFDLGVDERIAIDIRTKFDSIEREMDCNKCIDLKLDCEDVYNKRIYRYHINIIKASGYSDFNIYEIKEKKIIYVI